MSSSTEPAVVAALEAAVRDVGWDAVSDPARLRAILSDLLGVDADAHRGALDAIVISAEEGIPTELLNTGPEDMTNLRPQLVSRLQEWGLTAERAEWVVDAWVPLIPEPVAPPVPTVAPPPPTELPPAATPLLEPTELPASDSPVIAEPLIEGTVLPPTSLPGDAAVPALPDKTLLPDEAGRPPEATELPGEVAPVPPAPEAADESDLAGLPDSETAGRSRWPWAAALALLLAVGGGVFAVTNGSDDKGSDTDTTTNKTTSDRDEGVMTSGTVLAATEASPAQASDEFAMAGKNAGVRIAALGTVDQVASGAATQTPDNGDELLAFTLAKGPCENRPCGSWEDLDLSVAVDGDASPLPAGGPTYVVAAPEGDAPVELVFEGNGIEQRLSLRDGERGSDNIQVLLRTDRRTRVGETKQIEPTATDLDGSPLSFTLQGTTMTARVGSAELFFFGPDEPAPNPDEAYLSVDVTYSRGGSTNTFKPPRLVTFEAGGETYKLRDLDPGNAFDGAFVVPADLTEGTLVIEGTREVPTSGDESYLETIPRTTFKVEF